MRNKRCLSNVVLCFALCALSAAQSTWTSEGPTPRFGHTAILDSVSNKMIIFGGLPPATVTNGTQDLNGLWRFSVSTLTWKAGAPVGTPPAPRWGHSAVYDATNNRMIVFGGAEGRSSPCANDIWVLTNANGSAVATWTQLSPTGTAPAARTQHGAVYDPNTNSMIVFGGQDCFSTTFQDVWVLSNANGLGGTPTWTQLTVSGTGPGTQDPENGLAYDPGTNTLIFFGGNSGTSNAVWLLSNANGSGGTPTWTQLSISGTVPPPRAGNTLVYDSATNHITIFGGFDATSGADLSDTWVLSNANGTGGTPTWTQLAASSTYFPEARELHTAVYNPTANQMIVFGGYARTPDLSFSDVFLLNHANGQ